MEPTTPPIDLVEAARQAYDLEMSWSVDHVQALDAAISSVLEVHRAQVVSEVADTIQKYTYDLDADTDEFEHDHEVAVSYLTYTTELIRKLGHPEIEISTYVPKNGDLIQVITTGMVSVLNTYWKLTLDRGDILDFDIRREEPGVRVRLLDREE